MLKIEKLESYIGKAQILHAIDMEVRKNEIVCVIGPNGAGKTTLLNTISGLLSFSGDIFFMDEKINNKKPKEIIKSGIIHCPEGRLLFPEMSVLENLQMGAFLEKDEQQIQNNLQMVYRLFPRLQERTNQTASTLSGGEQQMLAIARSLMGKPQLLMLDEPSFGLAPVVRNNIFEAIRKIVNENKITVLLVEQNVHAAAEIATRFYVLEIGEIKFQGDKRELFENHDLVKAYFGKAA